VAQPSAARAATPLGARQRVSVRALRRCSERRDFERRGIDRER
jgi:hypothetical protein